MAALSCATQTHTRLWEKDRHGGMNEWMSECLCVLLIAVVVSKYLCFTYWCCGTCEGWVWPGTWEIPSVEILYLWHRTRNCRTGNHPETQAEIYVFLKLLTNFIIIENISLSLHNLFSFLLHSPCNKSCLCLSTVSCLPHNLRFGVNLKLWLQTGSHRTHLHTDKHSHWQSKQ